MKIFFVFFLLSSLVFSQSESLSHRPKFQKVYEFNNTISVPEQKKPALSILYSALLPGMGELYAGDYSTGKYFTIAEATFWVTYFGISTYANWERDNFKAYAKTKAGVKGDSYDDDYYATVSNYSDIEQYNNEMLLQRRFEYLYDVSTHYWKWESTTDRRAYRSMWVASQTAKNNLRFVVGALVLNRVVSIINAVRLTSAHNKKLQEEQSGSLYFSPEMFEGKSVGFSVNFVTTF